jgi:transcription-repair coupling factor (superfamily II helicase)
LLRLLELKLLAKRCGFSRIRPEQPNIVLETPMEEPAFRRLRQGLPTHLHGRLVYQGGAGTTAKVLARGLGALPIDKQLEDLKDWLEKMAAQLANPEAAGAGPEGAEAQNQRNADVLVV